MDISNFKRDSAKISAGAWVGDIPEAGGLRVRVRGMTSPEVVAARGRKIRAVPKKNRQRDGSLKIEDDLRILRELLAEQVLLEVEGLMNGDEELPLEQVKEMLLDPNYEPLADAVIWAAHAVDRDVADTQEQLEGN